jgi:hypothetical protein
MQKQIANIANALNRSTARPLDALDALDACQQTRLGPLYSHWVIMLTLGTCACAG